jgi:ketosteroid isomerase-like protein
MSDPVKKRRAGTKARRHFDGAGPAPGAMQTQKEENMRTLITLIAAACLVGAAFAQQLNPPPTPGPEHKKLEIWIGDWTYETIAQASPLGPAGKYVGKNTTRPILGGLFVEFRGEDKGPTGTTQWTETDGYDPLNQLYIWKGFASDGSFNDVSYTIEGTKVTHSGTVCTGGKTYRIRGTIVFTSDFTSNTEQREFSVDGKTWQPLWECRAAKITPAPADTASVQQEVIKLEDGWNTALLKSDVAYCDRILADNYTGTDDMGSVSTKAQELANLKSGDFKCTASVIENYQVHLYGDTAIFTAQSTQKAQYKGRDLSGQFQWTDTWVKHDGCWQCVASHGSKVPQKEAK